MPRIREALIVEFPVGEAMRVCFLLKVRSEKVEEYKQRHVEVWPEMLRALKKAGWHNYSLFMRQDGILVGYFETSDFEEARIAMRNHPINGQWQAEMSEYFEPMANGGVDESMIPLDEVFHLD